MLALRSVMGISFEVRDDSKRGNRPPFYIGYWLFCILTFSGGCDSNNFEQHTPEVIVESYLIAGEPLDFVRVSWSASSTRTYDFTANAIRGAEVRVLLLSDNGAGEITYRFTMRDEEPGVYRPEPVADMTVQAGRTYRLEVDVPGVADLVTATTIVPGAFETVRANADTVQYQGTGQLELDVTRSFYPGRQSIFVFSTEALDPRPELLTPFYSDISDGGEDDVADLRVTESPIINEANYDVNADGTLTIKLPWIAVAYYGPNRLTANALDDNMYDFIRTHSVQQGGSTLAPGEIPNVIDHVDGGNGVFGSLSRSIFEVFIRQ